MLIPHQNLHDLKTERGDVLPPLPVLLRLIPILFYLSAVGTIILVVLTVLQIGKASSELSAVAARTARIQDEIGETKTASDALGVRTKHAVDLMQWVEGSVGIQPLVVGITRSINDQSAITELALSRDDKTSSQLLLGLKLQTADTAQLDTTIEAIRQSAFRPFSAKQSQEGNHLSYEATLIRQSPTISQTSPAAPAPAHP